MAIDIDNAVCESCFTDIYLVNFIQQNGEEIEKCSVCGSDNDLGPLYAIDAGKLTDLFDPLIWMYSTVENFMPLPMLKGDGYEHWDNMIWNKLVDDWDIFDNYDVAQKIINMMYHVYSHDGETYDFLHSAVEIEADWYDHEEDVMNVSMYEWKYFCDEIRNENRFFPKKLNLDKLKYLLQANELILKKGFITYRGRKAACITPFVADKLLKPPSHKANVGRMNPKGISYFYCADSIKTVIHELRPLKNENVTVGIFSTTQNLKIVDLSNPFLESPFQYGKKLKSIYVLRKFMRELIEEISKLPDPNDPYLDYLPAQYVCEYIKVCGYDGIKYKSSQCDGRNFALFDDKHLRIGPIQFIQSPEMNYKFESKVV